MDVNVADVIAYNAAFVSSVMFIPQVRLAWRGEGGIAPFSACMSMWVFTSWLTYGVINTLWPVVVTNIATLSMMSTIMVLQWTRRGQRRGHAGATAAAAHVAPVVADSEAAACSANESAQ